MAIDRIHDYIVPGKRAHLVGIGGVSMSPLAEVLQGEGLIISGSDMKESPAVEHLRSLGIPVTIGHLPENVAGKDLVIRTAAVHDSNPEIARCPTLRASPSSSGPRLGGLSCGGMKTPCASPAPTARRPRPPCAPTLPWPPASTPP